MKHLCTASHHVKQGSIVWHDIKRGGAIFKGKSIRNVAFTLAVKMGSASLAFFVKYNNGEVGRCEVAYGD